MIVEEVGREVVGGDWRRGSGRGCEKGCVRGCEEVVGEVVREVIRGGDGSDWVVGSGCGRGGYWKWLWKKLWKLVVEEVVEVGGGRGCGSW